MPAYQTLSRNGEMEIQKMCRDSGRPSYRLIWHSPVSEKPFDLGAFTFDVLSDLNKTTSECMEKEVHKKTHKKGANRFRDIDIV